MFCEFFEKLVQLLLSSDFFDFDVSPSDQVRSGSFFYGVQLQSYKTAGVSFVALWRDGSGYYFIAVDPSGDLVALSDNTEVVPLFIFEEIMELMCCLWSDPAFPELTVNMTGIVCGDSFGANFHLRAVDHTVFVIASGRAVPGANLHAGVEGRVVNYSFKLQFKIAVVFIGAQKSGTKAAFRSTDNGTVFDME